MCAFLVSVPILQTTPLKLSTATLLFLLADFQYILLASYSCTEILIFRCTFLQLLISKLLIAIRPDSVRTSEALRTMAGTMGSCCSERTSGAQPCGCAVMPSPAPLFSSGNWFHHVGFSVKPSPSVPPPLKHAQYPQVLLILKETNLPCSCHL